MSLVVKPNEDGSADDYNVIHGDLRIGQIYKRKAALKPETQWVWALNPPIATRSSTTESL